MPRQRQGQKQRRRQIEAMNTMNTMNTMNADVVPETDENINDMIVNYDPAYIRAIQVSLDSAAGLQEAIEASRHSAGDELYENAREQLPNLTQEARHNLLLLVGLDDLINNETVSGNTDLELPRELTAKFQTALDTGEKMDIEDIEMTETLLEAYYVSNTIGGVYSRLLTDICELDSLEQEMEENKKRQEEEIIAALMKANQEKEIDQKKEDNTQTKSAEELRMERLLAFEKRFPKNTTTIDL
jgi:hypothetical protein